MAVDLRKIKKLIELVQESGINELEIKDGEEAIRIIRHGNIAAQALLREAQAEEERGVEHKVSAPLAGTCYLSAGQHSRAFTELGARVSHGDTLAVIDTMGILHQVTSDRGGTVKAILVDNASHVEYDQPLFIIAADTQNGADELKPA